MDIWEDIRISLLVLTTLSQLPGEVVVLASWDHLSKKSLDK